MRKDERDEGGGKEEKARHRLQVRQGVFLSDALQINPLLQVAFAIELGNDPTKSKVSMMRVVDGC